MYTMIPTDHNGVAFPVVGVVDRWRDDKVLAAVTKCAHGKVVAVPFVFFCDAHTARVFEDCRHGLVSGVAKPCS